MITSSFPSPNAIQTGKQVISSRVIPERKISFGGSLHSVKLSETTPSWVPQQSATFESNIVTPPIEPGPRLTSSTAAYTSNCSTIQTSMSSSPVPIQKKQSSSFTCPKIPSKSPILSGQSSNYYQPTALQSSVSTDPLPSHKSQSSETVTVSKQTIETVKLKGTGLFSNPVENDQIIKTSLTLSYGQNFDAETNIIKKKAQDTTLYPEVMTQPSSLSVVSSRAANDAKAMKLKLATRLNDLKLLVASLEKVLDSEISDINAYTTAVQESKLILHDVTHNLHTARQLVHTREDQLEEANKRVRLLMAEELSDCTSENLEDISDILWSGLQAATVALSRRQDKDAELAEQQAPPVAPAPEKATIQFVTTSIPEAKFVPIAGPHLKSHERSADHLCYEVILLVQDIQDSHKKKTLEFHMLQTSLKDLQTQITSTNEEYYKERTNLLLLEKKLDTRLRQVNRLTGRDTYDSLTVPQLAELCKTINKASRRLTTEQAIREVRAQQDSPELKDKEKEKCFVCFERPWDCRLEPCGHTLCLDCASRLRFCPHCRQDIQNTIKLDSAAAV